MIDDILARLRERGSDLAVAAPSGVASADTLLACVGAWRDCLADRRIGRGRVVSIEGDYGVQAIAAALALVRDGHIIVPLSSDSRAHHETFSDIAAIEYRIIVDDATIRATGRSADHGHYRTIRDRRHPGLVLFSSGSTGRPKAAVHDLDPLLKKFLQPRPPFRTLAFLQLDHIGGINTLLYNLANGSGLVVAPSRSPEAVCEVIERHRVELLPTSPTFLNLMLVSGQHERFDLSSLRLITYGTEPMPSSTLQAVRRALPNVDLRQTYGLTELGILRAKSRGADSLWVKVGGEGFDTKIVGDRLWIKAESAMLGYLNAPSPFDADGYFDTGDLVEREGEWLKIKGRESDLINVGGSKVYPAEVESALLEMENVADVSVHGEPHPLTGQIVVACVRLRAEESAVVFKNRMREFCAGRLERYKIPAKVVFSEEALYSSRCKRRRTPGGRVAVVAE